MDFIGVIMFFVKEILMSTYDMMVPPVLNIFGQAGKRVPVKTLF